MATFEQDGGNLANQILGNQKPQQKINKITSPPFSGPDSGKVPAHLPGVIKAKGNRIEVCVDLPAFIQRLQYGQYLGAEATAIGANFNYAYTIAPTVPQGRYWILEYASVSLLNTGSEGFPGLWLMPPGQLPAANAEPYQDNPAVFANTEAAPGAVANGPWVLRGIRVDEADIVTQLDGPGVKKYAEVVLVRARRLIIPQGWTLMAYGGGGGFGQGGSLGEQWLLNIAYSEFLMSEDTDVK